MEVRLLLRRRLQVRICAHETLEDYREDLYDCLTLGFFIGRRLHNLRGV